MADLEDCDVLVVGGGIHGVGVAQAAAAAGYSTTLVESRDLAAGTSSKSSKLIHGGLRYLESFEIGLVRESLRERELLLEIAPELVHRQTFYVPVYKDTSRHPLTLRAGLSLYAILAGLKKSVRFRTVPRREWSELDGLKTDGLKTVFAYTDAQTNDRELTKSVMQSAVELGAQLICPAEFVAAKINKDHYEVTLSIDGVEQTCRASVVVNAAGPWANQVLERVTPNQDPFAVDLVQGTHLELPGTVDKGCYYIEMPSDKRAVFVIPWQGRTMLGTTEHVYSGAPENVKPLDEETDYLLAGYRAYFPDRSTDVLDSWSGLRVLPAATGKAFKRSRETQLPVDNTSRPRLISIFGGKLTGYRATALKVIKKIKPSLPSRDPIGDTSTIALRPVE